MHVCGRQMEDRKRVPLCFGELLCIIFSEGVFHETFGKMSDEY